METRTIGSTRWLYCTDLTRSDPVEGEAADVSDENPGEFVWDPPAEVSFKVPKGSV